MSNRYNKLGANMIWMIIGNFASKLLVFLLVPLYTNFLSTEEYAISDLITTTVSLALPLFSLLMSEAIMRFTLEDANDKKQVFSICMLITIIGGAVLISTIPLLNCISVLRQYMLEFFLYYFSTVVLLNLQQFEKGIEHIKIFVLSGIINTLANILLNILFLCIFGWRIEGYLLAFIIGNAITILFISVFDKIWLYFANPFRLKHKLIKAIVLFSLPLIPNSLSWWVSNSSDKYILMFICGPAITGVYSVAYKIPSLMTSISSIFTSAWQISAVENFGSEASRRFFSDVYRKYTSIYIVLVSGIILFIKVVAKILFSKDFYDAWRFAGILTVAALFQALCSYIGSIYTTAMKTNMIFWTTLIGAVVNIVLNFVLIPSLGAYGAAISTLVSYIVVWGVRLVDSRRIMKLDIDWLRNIISFVLLFLQCVLLWAVDGYKYYLSAVITIVIIILNRNVLVDAWNMILAYVKKVKQR